MPITYLFPHLFSTPFNTFLDKMRDPKDIQEEVLKKKLKTIHPFKGDLVKSLLLSCLIPRE